MLEAYAIKLAQRCGKHISVAEPLLDATLMDTEIVMKLGRRFPRGFAFCIRRFRDDLFSCDIVAFRTMSSLMVAYLWIAFQNEVPMLFVGGTASGKTTTLNAMCIFIPWQMKIVSIESTREVNIPTELGAGTDATGFGGESNEGEIGEFEQPKAALRERPEYIIVGRSVVPRPTPVPSHGHGTLCLFDGAAVRCPPSCTVSRTSRSTSHGCCCPPSRPARSDPDANQREARDGQATRGDRRHRPQFDGGHHE